MSSFPFLAIQDSTPARRWSRLPHEDPQRPAHLCEAVQREADFRTLVRVVTRFISD